MKNEINDLYDYGYKIVQNPQYFKFSLDSIILADFVNIKKTDKKLLDLCTGNAPIPIILSNKIEKITAIELQKPIYKMAEESIKINKIDNIKLINDNIKNYENYFLGNNFDIITCNPPYFKYQKDSIINENMVKSIARHEITITIEEIISIASKLIKPKGRFYIVHRSERLIDIINLLEKNSFGIKTMQFVYDDYQKKSSMVLIEAMFDGKNNCQILNPLITKNYRRENL